MALDADETKIGREELGTPTTVKSGLHDGGLWSSDPLKLDVHEIQDDALYSGCVGA